MATTFDPEVRIIRPLSAVDAAALQALRLRALREDPLPFLATHDEEAHQTLEAIAQRLEKSAPGTEVLGAFRGATLRGMLGYHRHERVKARHRASLWGMYVAPEDRRRGTGRALVEEAIARLRLVEGIAQIELTVVEAAEPARRLYGALGFEVQGRLRRAMKTPAGVFDEELMVLLLDAPLTG
jgi:ribosomal protein S18 acetylase RimI-like enzyme